MTEAPLTIFAAGAAHIDRRGRPSGIYRAKASNPGSVSELVGGSVFNASLAMRLFGARVLLLSARGGDAEAVRVAEALAAADISDLGMVWLDRRTPTYTAIIDHRGELVGGIADMLLYEHLNRRLVLRRHTRDAMAASDALLFDTNIPDTAIGTLIESFAGRPTVAIGVSPVKAAKLGPFLPELTAVFLSRAEAASLAEATPNTSVSVLARLLQENGACRVVITDGPRDVAILDEDVVRLQAPPPVASLRDVTGAGDTLAGVALLAFVRGQSFVDAVRLGIAAASRRIGAEGLDGPDPAGDIAGVAASMMPARAVIDDNV